MGGPGSGPPRTPTAVLKARGSWLAQARTAGGEVAGRPGKPRPPRSLTPRAAEHFRAIVRELEYLGVLTMADGDVVAAYCRTWDRLEAADEFLARAGLVRITRGPSPGKDPTTGEDLPGPVESVDLWPQVGVAERATEALMRLGDRLGLNPSARSRLRREPSTAPGVPAGTVVEGKGRFFGTTPGAGAAPPTMPPDTLRERLADAGG